MKAVNSVPISTDKIDLGKAVPIATPFLIYAEPSSFCNLKCRFCPNPTVPNEHKQFMSMEIFEKIIQDIKEFPSKPKVFKFCGIGESLTNKHISEMIKMVRDSNSAERIIMYSNGVLLNPTLNRQLVEAGLNQLNVSVEAMDGDGYLEYAGVKINFDRFVENIRNLYENRKQLKLYIKIHSAAIKNDEQKEKFYKTFGDISDFITIEGLTHIWGDFKSDLEENAYRYSNDEVKKRQVCAICFKTLNVNADGTCSPCSVDWQHKVIVGDLKKESLVEIWNGERLRSLRKRFCSGTIGKEEACFDCSDYYVSGHENLDDDALEILKRL